MYMYMYAYSVYLSMLNTYTCVTVSVTAYLPQILVSGEGVGITCEKIKGTIPVIKKFKVPYRSSIELTPNVERTSTVMYMYVLNPRCTPD